MDRLFAIIETHPMIFAALFIILLSAVIILVYVVLKTDKLKIKYGKFSIDVGGGDAKSSSEVKLMSVKKNERNLTTSHKVTREIYEDINWEKLFKSSKSFEGLFVYHKTWRGLLTKHLKAFSERHDCMFIVHLPNPSDNALLIELSRRFKVTPDEVSYWIKEAESDLIKLFSKKANGFRFTINYISVTPLYHLYKFDNDTIISFYTHQDTRGDFLTLHEEGIGQCHHFSQLELISIRSRILDRASTSPSQ